MKIILASASPRRRDLLTAAGFEFEVIPANVDETADPGLPPEELAAALSKKKALHVQPIVPGDAIIIGADTIVVTDNEILGKPKDEANAFAMLFKLQGRRHTVYTGVTILSHKLIKTFTESTSVFMRSLTEPEIRRYIATGEPMDKAGAYGIQEKGALLIKRIEGDYFTVVGLPLCRLNIEIKSMVEV